MNFKADPPFNELRQGFASFKKETRMAPRKEIVPELFDKLLFIKINYNLRNE